MNSIDIFYVTQKLEILDVHPDTGKIHIYHSRIEDITAHSLLIAPPYSHGFYLPPRRRPLQARVPAKDCAYGFTTQLLRQQQDGILLWEVALPTAYTRLQRREFVRFPIHLPVSLHLPEQEPLSTFTKNISAGGLRVLLEAPLPTPATLSLDLTLDADTTLSLQGELLRIIVPETEEAKYEAIIQFQKIPDAIRTRIIQFIFKKQIERRQRDAELFEE